MASKFASAARAQRTAFGGQLFAGFAPMPLSAAAKPIATDSKGLTAGMQRIPVKDGALPAYVALPQGGYKRPVVIVVPEVWGLHEYIRDVCRRLAKDGYLAIAPDFFVRAGDPAPLTEWADIAKIVATATHAQVMGDIGATLSHIERGDLRGADPSRIAITGFCWGAPGWRARSSRNSGPASPGTGGSRNPPRPTPCSPTTGRSRSTSPRN